MTIHSLVMRAHNSLNYYSREIGMHDIGSRPLTSPRAPVSETLHLPQDFPNQSPNIHRGRPCR